MTGSEKDVEKRLAQLKREVPTRGLERYPWVVTNVSDLPTELQSRTVVSLAAREAIQTIIVFPPQIHRGWHYVPKQALLFTLLDVTHVQASIWPDQEPQVTHVRGSDLMYMKVTLLLLYGHLEVVAQGHASPTRLSMEFNTVAWYRLSLPLRRLLLATRATPGAPGSETTYAPAVQHAFERLPLKFSNGVKIYGLLPGEELKELVFQPGTWKRWLLLFRRPVSANTLLSLTSNYVTVIQEELDVELGWIISYIPRSSIEGMQSQPRGPWSELTVQLRRGDQLAGYKLLLEDEAAQAWRRRWMAHGGQWEDLPEEMG